MKKIPNRKAFIGQLLRYFITGGLATVVDFTFYALAVRIAEMHYLLANLVALLAGGTINYLLSFRWVFSSETRRLEKAKILEIVIFVAICLLGMVLNECLMFIFVEKMAVWDIVAKAFATMIVFMWNFLARKFILFSQKKGDK